MNQDSLRAEETKVATKSQIDTETLQEEVNVDNSVTQPQVSESPTSILADKKKMKFEDLDRFGEEQKSIEVLH